MADSAQLPGPITGDELARLISGSPPLVEGMLDPRTQMTPNGVDLTAAEVSWFSDDTPGRLDFDNSDRLLPETEAIPWREGRLILPPGAYVIRYSEKVNLPRDVLALGKPRSSLLRCGAHLGSAVWDAGYSGRGQGLLVVFNPAGLELTLRARVLQLVFFRLKGETAGYRGGYQGEGT
ncbi:MAG: deoxyuridine 5'-triphosphate nucleotidohydrolase [bacterium]|nr:deoxyuridine 5'-triphosphate nucleotidohydrolase [bacterium]